MKGVFAIGDIHGHATMLDRLLGLLPREEADRLIFLGDYIDRGPDSAGVVERVKAEIQTGAVALWGNHEDMAAAAHGLESPGRFETLQAGATWMHGPNGGPDTCRSYGVNYDHRNCPPALAELFPQLKLFHVEPELGVEFVHGFAPPGKTLEEAAQPSLRMDRGPAALLWGRPDGSEFAWDMHWYRRQARRRQHLTRMTDLVQRVNAATIAEMKQIQADARAHIEENQEA